MTVGGRHELRVSSMSQALTMTNVRFVVEDGSWLNFRLDDDDRGYEHQRGGRGSTTLKFQGIAQQVSPQSTVSRPQQSAVTIPLLYRRPRWLGRIYYSQFRGFNYHGVHI